jgi:DNA-directed RNA polymerase subunit RPC12/RpoP
MSIEGGVPGMQQRLVCPNCGKVFFAWRPDTGPGAKIKCYFCKHEFEDEAARRAPLPPAPAPAPASPPATPDPAPTTPAS